MELALTDDFAVGLTKEEAWDRIDQCCAVMADMGGVGKEAFQTKHTFTEGLYGRILFMPEGTLVVSEIHETQHQYAVLMGRIRVWTFENGWVTVEAPAHGITNPGTRRLLLVETDSVWATFHPILEGETTHEQVEERILGKRINPYLQLTEHE